MVVAVSLLGAAFALMFGNVKSINEDIKITIQNSILDTFLLWLPFIEIITLDIEMSDRNTLKIFLELQLD